MPDVRRQIPDFGAPTTGEAWMRICRRLRLELGEDVFSSWFGCLELDALSDADAYLSVPTKFLKSWIQSHYTDKIVQALASEFPLTKRVSINVRTSTRLVPPHAIGSHLDPVPCGDANLVKGRNITSLASSSQMVASTAAMPSSKKSALMEGCEAETLCGSPLDRRLIFSNFLVGSSNQLAHAAAQKSLPRRRETHCFSIRFISTLLSDWVRPTFSKPPRMLPPRQSTKSSISPPSDSCMVSSPPSKRRRRSLSRKGCERLIFS